MVDYSLTDWLYDVSNFLYYKPCSGYLSRCLFMHTCQCSPRDFSRPLIYCQLYLFKRVAEKNTSVPKESLAFCSYFMIPQVGSYYPWTWHTPPDLLHSLMPQEPDNDDAEWRHLLETTEPVPVQLKAPLTLLCNPDFCQRIQSQLHEAGGQVTSRSIPWMKLETVFTDEALKNVDWHKEKESLSLSYSLSLRLFNSRRFASLL